MTPTIPARTARPAGSPGHVPRLGPAIVALGQAAALALLPDGAQRTARRNAWAGMSADSTRGRARREGEAALEAAVRRASAPARIAAQGG